VIKCRLRSVMASMCVLGVATAGAVGCSESRSGPMGSPSASSTEATVRHVGQDTLVRVSPGSSISVNIPGVVSIAGSAHSFTRAGTITITQEEATFASSSGLEAAGRGIGITFQGTTLAKPLSLTFDVHAQPSSGELPVVAHRSDDGSWDVHAATDRGSGRITYSTKSFSINIPGWGTAVRWFDDLASAVTSAVGGRTSPLTCPGNPPGWFHLDSAHSDLVHVCATTNRTSDGTEVAEVQIKSNRGVSLEVTVPGDPAYVWVDGEPWAYREFLGAHLGFDPNRTVILPPGGWMTVGYPRENISAPWSFFVTGATWGAVADTISRRLIELAVGKAPELVEVGYTEAQCATAFEAGASSLTFGANDFYHFVTCWTGDAAKYLVEPENALNLASQFGIPEGEDAADELADRAKTIEALGWLAALWPLFQLGIGNDIDKIHELLTGGGSALVTYHFDPLPPPSSTTPIQPSATSRTTAAPPSTGNSTPPASKPVSAPPTQTNPQPVNAYNNYGPANAGRAMCRGNAGEPVSTPGGTASQSFTVPSGVASLSSALVQIDPDSTVTAHLTVAVNGATEATTTAAAAGDTTFSFGPVAVRPGDTVTMSITFTATSGKIITVYTAGSPGGSFTASNSCPDSAPSLTSTTTGLRAVVSGAS
jgi:hypothetical protein